MRAFLWTVLVLVTLQAIVLITSDSKPVQLSESWRRVHLVIRSALGCWAITLLIQYPNSVSSSCAPVRASDLGAVLLIRADENEKPRAKGARMDLHHVGLDKHPETGHGSGKCDGGPAC